MTGRGQTPCTCRWTPGIDLPTYECEQHRDDPSLAHQWRRQSSCESPHYPCCPHCQDECDPKDMHSAACQVAGCTRSWLRRRLRCAVMGHDIPRPFSEGLPCRRCGFAWATKPWWRPW